MGEATNQEPGRRACEGECLPETDVLFWPLVSPVKPLTEFTDYPERS